MPARQSNAPTTVSSEFLKLAADRDLCILGTVPSGSAGGGSSNVTWQDVVPTVPGLLVELHYIINFSAQVQIGTSGQAITVSPFAPYSAWANQLTLGGAPPWPLTELTPWWLDELTDYTDWDPSYPGLGNNASPAGLNLDLGPAATAESIGTAPGTVHTATAANQTFTDNFVFKVRIRLQQKRNLLYGAIPMGDPENKIRNVTQLLPLIGSNPEQCLYFNQGTGTFTASLASQATVYAIYRIRYIDLLPSSETNIPLPAIGYGVQMNANSQGITNAAQQNKYYHRDSMAFLKIMHLLINGSQTLYQQQASYFALWDTQEQKSARWEFDTAQNTFQRYFDRFHRIYRRYPLKGFYVADFVSGDDPDIPGATPYNAIMSPDANYAEAFDVAVTPAMTTTLTVPQGTTMTSAYERVYSKGLVGVAY